MIYTKAGEKIHRFGLKEEPDDLDHQEHSSYLHHGIQSCIMVMSFAPAK